MASNLYPLVFKPGIKRDGTPFQAEYCTDGFWVRFYQGKARKIGGMLGAGGNGFPIDLNITTIFPYSVNGTNYMFLGNNAGITYTTINPITFTVNIAAPNPKEVPGFGYDPNAVDTLWQVISVNNTINGQTKNALACLDGSSLNNITATNMAPKLKIIGFTTAGDPPVVTLTTTIIDPVSIPGASGILFVAPFLFVYSENGLLQWSKPVGRTPSGDPDPADPVDIRSFDVKKRSATIADDKIIFGASIRGGSLSPTLLFWTLSSVIRVTNTAGTEILNLKVDPVTKDCSILSSRCVVEHNGLFFWPGTDNFYFYNGVVDVMVNTMNLRYFFDNIDMQYRQKVFGVKNKKYNEIWWFYPEKMGLEGRPEIGAPPAPVPAGTITRAIIYNLTENSWYDTQIVRDCGYWDNVTGNMYTFGDKLPPGVLAVKTKYLWRHEYQDAITKAVPELVIGNNPTPINSSFTTPTISWAAFNPMKQLTGVDRWMDIRRIEPDFVVQLNAAGNKVATTFNITINSQEYAQSPVIDYPVPANITQATQKIDIDRQGRHITFTISSSGMFEMGHVIIDLGVGDGR